MPESILSLIIPLGDGEFYEMGHNPRFVSHRLYADE